MENRLQYELKNFSKRNAFIERRLRLNMHEYRGSFSDWIQINNINL